MYITYCVVNSVTRKTFIVLWRSTIISTWPQQWLLKNCWISCMTSSSTVLMYDRNSTNYVFVFVRCVCVRLCVRCVCVCVSPKIHTYVYMYVCVCIIFQDVIDVVKDSADAKESKNVTLRQMFNELGLTKDNMNVDKLGVAGSAKMFHRFDHFNAAYNPFGASKLRKVFIKINNHQNGKYFAEIIRGVFNRITRHKSNVLIEPRLSGIKYLLIPFYLFVQCFCNRICYLDGWYLNGLWCSLHLSLSLSLSLIALHCPTKWSVYGATIHDWDRLAKWVCKYNLFADHVRWIVQVPRLYKVFRSKGVVKVCTNTVYTQCACDSLCPFLCVCDMYYIMHIVCFFCFCRALRNGLRMCSNRCLKWRIIRKVTPNCTSFWK